MWELDHKEGQAPKNWCFLPVVLGKTLESPLDCKEIKSTLNIHWKDRCWSWSFSTLATWGEESTHWKRPCCWEKLKAAGEGDNREQWWEGITNSTDMNLSKLWEMVKDRGAWHAAIHGVTKSQTWLSHWTRFQRRAQPRFLLKARHTDFLGPSGNAPPLKDSNTCPIS